MSFWDFFQKKNKGNKGRAATDSGAAFVPIIAASDAGSPADNQASQGGHDVGAATSTDSGAGSFGSDGGGASGDDGGGS